MHNESAKTPWYDKHIYATLSVHLKDDRDVEDVINEMRPFIEAHREHGIAEDRAELREKIEAMKERDVELYQTQIRGMSVDGKLEMNAELNATIITYDDILSLLGSSNTK